MLLFAPLQSNHTSKPNKPKPFNNIDHAEANLKKIFLRRTAAFQKASPNIEFEN